MEAIGTPIPGSQYVRDYCAVCNTPIRVVCPSRENTCSECDPPEDKTADSNSIRGRDKLAPKDEEASEMYDYARTRIDNN